MNGTLTYKCRDCGEVFKHKRTDLPATGSPRLVLGNVANIQFAAHPHPPESYGLADLISVQTDEE